MKLKKKDQKTFKSKKLSKSKMMVKSLDFLISKARLMFTKLRQVFVKALILYHFDPKRHIRIEINKLGYAIDRVFSQLIFDNLSQ